MAVSAQFTVNQSAIAQLTRRGGIIDADMERRSRKVLAPSVMQAPVLTGRMRASGHVAPYLAIAAAWQVIFDVGYSLYVDQGYRRRRKRGGVTVVPGRPFLSGNIDQAI